MKCTSLWIKKQIPEWTSFFSKIIGNLDLTVSRPQITAEDIASISNVDWASNTNHEIHKKQIELIQASLHAENDVVGWKTKVHESYTVHFKWIEHTNVVISKTETIIPAPLGDVVEFLKENIDSPSLSPMLVEWRTIEKFNENLSVVHASYKLPILTNRDFVFLNYHEYLPEEKFSITCHISVEREDVPPVPGYIRAITTGAWIFRGTANDTTHVTYTFNIDGKGKLSSAPKSVVKHAAKQEAIKAKKLYEHFANKK